MAEADWRRRLQATVWGRVLWSIAANVRNRSRLKPGSPISLRFDAQPRPDPEQEAGYAQYMFEDYLRVLNRLGYDLQDADVLELGPGEHLGVSLCCLAHGARRVVGIDKYAVERDAAFEQAVYAALEALQPPASRATFAEVRARYLQLGERFPGIRQLVNCPVETADSQLQGQTFSTILSRSVLEYLKDGDRAFEAMDRLLAPGGVMIHKVDCRDDGLFTHFGHHPLTFLTLSDQTYRWMTSHTYRPNRLRVSWYRSKLQELGYMVNLLVTRLAGHSRELPSPAERLQPNLHYTQQDVQLIDAIRPRLARDFAGLSDEDLMTAGFFLVGVKPVS